MNESTNQVTNSQPKFNTHKVFAAVGIILTIIIIAIAAIWYFSGGNFSSTDEDNTVKVSTTSAKPSTNPATKSATTSAQ